jgi:hypothetical protein
MSGHPDLAGALWRKSTRSADGADCVEVVPVLDDPPSPLTVEVPQR